MASSQQLTAKKSSKSALATSSNKSFPCTVKGCVKAYRHAYSLTRHLETHHQQHAPDRLTRQRAVAGDGADNNEDDEVDDEVNVDDDYDDESACVVGNAFVESNRATAYQNDQYLRECMLAELGVVKNHSDGYCTDNDESERPTAKQQRYARTTQLRWGRDEPVEARASNILQPSETALMCEHFLSEFEANVDRRPSNRLEHLIDAVRWSLYNRQRCYEAMLALCDSASKLSDETGNLFLVKFVWELTRNWTIEQSQQGPEWDQLVTVFAFGAALRIKHPQMHNQVVAMLTYFMASYGEQLMRHRGGWSDFVSYCDQDEH